MWMMLITAVCGIISGMGIGGGSIFILLTTIFNILEQKQAQGYNLILFITVGVVASIYNIKNKSIDKKLFIQIIIPLCLGSLTGILLLKNLNENFLKNSFYIFMIVIGLYEIISSLKKIYIAKNNKNERS